LRRRLDDDETAASLSALLPCHVRGTIASGARSAILAVRDASTSADARVPPDRGRLVADRAPLPVPRPRPRAPAAGGRLRPGGKPHLESRPLGARDGDLPAALSPLHGEVRALLVPARAVRQGRRRVQGA